MASKHKAAVVDLDNVPAGQQICNVNPHLKAFLRDITTIRKDEDNARHHPERSIQDIATSYQKFGQQKPIVIYPDGKLIAGEGQWIAARDRLGWTHIAAVEFDIGRPLTRDELDSFAEQYGVMDNRSAESSEWDYEVLGQKMKRMVEQGVELGDIGWLLSEASTIMSADWTPPEVKPLDQDHGKTYSVAFTERQWKIVERVVAKVQKVKGEEMEQADALVLALRTYLGPGEQKGIG